MNRIQPVCETMTRDGELVWEFRGMERWQELQIFKRTYSGGFAEQWWHLNAYARGEALGYEEREPEKSVLYRQFTKQQIALQLEKARENREERVTFPLIEVVEEVGQIYAYGWTINRGGESEKYKRAA